MRKKTKSWEKVAEKLAEFQDLPPDVYLAVFGLADEDASKNILAKCLKMLKFTEGLKLCDLEMPAQARKKSKIAPCLLGEL